MSDVVRARSSLESLLLVPTGGLCNRLRAIASARRLSARFNFKLTIVWDWGDFGDYFHPLPGVAILPSLPAAGRKVVRHYPMLIDPTPFRAVEMSDGAIELHSGYIFSARGEKPINSKALIPFTPRPNDRLAFMIDEFAGRNLSNAVGFHIRRTDHVRARRYSPDGLFFRRAREIVSQGKSIFLATDNILTERMMTESFGSSLIKYPKRSGLDRRWPRPFDRIATEDDVIDLFLLARTQYILGSYNSTYSHTAMRLNGSPQCAILASGWRVRVGRVFFSIRAGVIGKLPFLKRALQRRHDRKCQGASSRAGPGSRPAA
jgi:hypothetical protein